MLNTLLKIVHPVSTTRISPPYHNLFILIFLSFSIINQTGCGRKDDEIKPTDKTFVTKKKTFLYGDVHARETIGKIPGFTTLKARRKMIIQRSAGMVAVYYEVTFNEQQGWVQAIYLAEVLDDEKQKESSKRKSPNVASKTKSKTQRTDKIKSKAVKGTKKSGKLSRPSQQAQADHKTDLEKQPISVKHQQSFEQETAPVSNINKLFSVQIGSFKDKGYALNLANNIRSLGFETHLDEFYGNSGLWFRVRVGKYNFKKDANQTANAIRSAYPLEPWIVSITDAHPPQKKHYSVSPEETEIKTEYYTIQVSSVKNKAEANLLANKLGDAGYPSVVSRVVIKDKIWYRVRHGEYKMITIAKRVADEIKNKYKLNPWISNIYK